MQCQLTQRVVVRYCTTIESVERVRSCRDWVTDFYFIFLWLTTATEICFAVFRLTALRPAAKLVYVCCVQTFNIMMSFPSLVENQDNRKKDITHVSRLFRTKTREIKTSDDFYRILRIRLCANIATQFKSCDDSFARLQLFCLSILSCNKLRVTNCTMITSRMNHQMF